MLDRGIGYRCGAWVATAAARLKADTARLAVLMDVGARRRHGTHRANDLFLAVLAHELRGPLTAVIGWLELGVRSADDPAAQRHALETALRNARHQADLIERVLEVSRLASGKLFVERRPMALDSALGEALHSWRPYAQERGIELRCTANERLTIAGDRARMLQVFGHLLGNAIKFGRPGGSVDVRLESAGGGARITVADDGIGIATEALPGIFEPFWQGADGERRHAGLGLGLALVRHIVEQHAGRISVESDGPDLGTCVTLELPLAAEARRAPAAEEPGSSRERAEAATLQ